MSIALLLLSQLAWAGSLAGVTLPDTATVGGETLQLNGLGLREKFFIDVYAGGLYVKAKSSDAKAMRETFNEGFAANGGKAFTTQIQTLNGYMEDLTTGDQVVIDYAPGIGTTVSVKGKAKGTIEGADFMRALFAVYLGDSPPTSALKQGLLGG